MKKKREASLLEGICWAIFILLATIAIHEEYPIPEPLEPWRVHRTKRQADMMRVEPSYRCINETDDSLNVLTTP